MISKPINVTASRVVRTKPGELCGFMVNSHTNGTMKLLDGTENSVVAVGTFTINSGALAKGVHPSATLTSTGAMVAGSHASSVFTVTGNMKDAVAASSVLTTDNTETADASVVVLGSITYRFKTTPSAAYDIPIMASADATLQKFADAVNREGIYTATNVSSHAITITAKTKGTAANSDTTTTTSAHLSWTGGTLSGGLAAETVTINATVYTFKDLPSAAYDVKIGSTAAITLDNLKAAINGSGTPGLQYCQGTVAHPNVYATTNTDTAQTVIARVPGTTPNAYATTETSASASWADTTLGGGTGASVTGVTTAAATVTIGTKVYTVVTALSETSGAAAIANQVLYGSSVATMLDNLKKAINGTGTAGTEYSTGTVAHTQVFATTNADDSQVVVGRLSGTSLNTVATTETMANTAWGGSTLGGAGNTAGVAGETFTIGTRTYTWETVLTETYGLPAVADQILWTSSDAVALDNMKLAINASGVAGTDYSTGTTANTQVEATTNGAASQVISARVLGVSGNSIVTTTTAATSTWGAGTLASGAGADATIILNTMTFAAGPYAVDFNNPIAFTRGLMAIIGGTAADVSLLVNG